MKTFTKFIFLFFIINYSIAMPNNNGDDLNKLNSLDIPDMIPSAQKTKQANNVWYYTTITKGDNNISAVTDFNKIDEIRNGIFIAPLAYLENNEWKYELNYVYLDCNNRKNIFSIGPWRENFFDKLGSFTEKNSPIEVEWNSFAGRMIPFVCGFDLINDGRKVIAHQWNQGSMYWGFIPQSLTKINDVGDFELLVKEFNVDEKPYAFEITPLNTDKMTINCLNKTVKLTNGETQNVEQATHGKQFSNYFYLLNKSCEYAQNNNIPNKLAPEVKEIQPDMDNQDLKKKSLADAKEECLNLGFKEKTEKFGECVLELVE